MSDPSWAALWLSLRVASMSTLLALVVALPLAALTARRRFAGRALLDALLLVPLVLPPTVVGYLLLVTFGRRGPVGGLLARVWDGSLIFSVEGAVLAAAIVAFPLIYLPTKSGMAAIAQEMLDNARISGASRGQLFRHVLVPMAIKSIGAGTVLGFARALGEFGATLMVLGWQPGKTTLPILIYSAYTDGRLADAWLPVSLLTTTSLGIVALYHRLLRDE
jgi:molybdate transport system permease protein